MILGFIYVLAVFGLQIDCLEKYGKKDIVFILGITLEDPNGDIHSNSFQLGLFSMVIALTQFVSCQVYFKAYSSF
jgi:hypothetical protein